ncbi:shikimate kinase [Arcobacter sp. FWKO B]|uniref:shikimate kinase n=1 Tax=Arcobacter sp. FWKO B TaxID=2593672 RepID=UPI0018A45AE2|nr:shikimate kinase [Arcobacter sp. FWKO B]QOG11958.1 shikimate kinase [Arcobacter sp. FWKO B]
MKKNNIILIGFMGVGKGTIARAVVKSQGVFAVDTDDLIESMQNQKIKKIFEKEGEPYFRELEQKCANWIEANVDNTLISTGGGFFMRPNIKNLGHIVYLKSSFEGILKRIKKSPNASSKLKKRPLLKDMKKAKELYDKRVPQYEAIADLVVDVEHKSLQEIVDFIIQGVGHDCKNDKI